MDGGKRKSGGTIESFFGAPTKKSKSSGDDAAAGAGAGAGAVGAGAAAVAGAAAPAPPPAEAPVGAQEAGAAAGCADADATAGGSSLPAAERRRIGINKSLALARRAHAAAAAVVAAAAAEGRPPALADLIVDASWREALAGDLSRDSFRSLESFLRSEWAARVQVFPPATSLFAALNATPLASVRVVILGQDPYHDDGQAMGLSFSVPVGVRVPSSLANIFKELASDVGATRPSHGDLSRWAAQGVLLLNSALSVRAHAAASHAKRGWESFTDGVVRALLAARRAAASSPNPPPPLVFLLWGKHAQEKGQGVLRAAGAARLCTVLEAPHPSGLSAHRGFFGCRHFSKANAALVAGGGEPIDWQIV